MSGYIPSERIEPLRPSKTSKYFIKTGVKKIKFNKSNYTKTDSEGRVCLYSKDHEFIKFILNE